MKNRPNATGRYVTCNVRSGTRNRGIAGQKDCADENEQGLGGNVLMHGEGGE